MNLEKRVVEVEGQIREQQSLWSARLVCDSGNPEDTHIGEYREGEKKMKPTETCPQES